jgi:hypothetical protein
MKTTLVLIFSGFLFAAAACTKSSDTPVGHYQIITGTLEVPVPKEDTLSERSGTVRNVPIILKIDTWTGDAWVLYQPSGERTKWVSIHNE